MISKTKNLKHFFIFLLGFSSLFLNAEGIKKSKSTVLTGSIIDLKNQENLAGVEVTLLETGTKTYTDFDGNYKFESLLVGDYTIKVSLISYADSEIKVSIEEQSKKNRKTIFMQPKE